jgi:hypothetical protein
MYVNRRLLATRLRRSEKRDKNHGIDPVVFDLGIPAIGLTGQTERYASLSRLDQMLTIAR